LPLALAGCTSTNPNAAFKDVDDTVKARAGESARWLRDDAQSRDAAQTVEMLLRTNLTAQSAVTIALLNNRALQAKYEEIGISQAELAQVSRLHNPVLFGSWRFPNQPPSFLDAEYSASADFLDVLTLHARKKIAAQNLAAMKWHVADEVLRSGAEVQSAFYTMQAGQDLISRLSAVAELNGEAADFAQRQYDAGNINDLQLLNFQAAAAQGRLDVMQAKMQAAMDRERLNRLLGLSGAQINWKIGEPLAPPMASEPPLENLEALAVSQRLDLIAMRGERDALAAALRLKKNTRLIPGATVGIDTERSVNGDAGQRVTGPTLSVEVPLFDQGQPAVARLAAQFRQAQDHLDAMEVDVRSEVRQAQEALLSARAIAEHYDKTLLPQRRLIVRQTLLQYNAMQKDTYELLAAKEHEQNAERGYVEALRDYWMARAMLERAVGGRLQGGVAGAKSEAAKPEMPDMPGMPGMHHH
jgi:cobalt-zinc-cadmium efflux system outer membrane protein